MRRQLLATAMILAFAALAILAGTFSYVSLPKEGEPDIEIPALFISVPFPGISALDSETMLVKVMETELSDLDGLKKMTGTASEGYGGLVLEFEFGWDKTATLADVRDRMGRAESQFPAGFDTYSINEINFSQFPIIIVSLSGDVPERTLLRLAREMQDRIEGLDAGADDYMTKPFSVRELLARIRAVLRRTEESFSVPGEKVLASGDLTLIPDRHQVLRDGQEVPLTLTEFRILELLMKAPGRVMSREILMEQVWGESFFGDTRTIDVHVRHLREKVEEDPANPRFILTVRGVGYKFREIR